MKKPKESKKLINLVIMLVVILTSLFYLFFIYDDGNYAAKIDNTIISYEALDNQSASTIKFYQVNNQEYDENIIRKNSLDELIRKALVEDYAKKNNILVIQKDIDNYYMQRINKAGSEEKLLSDVENLWGLDKEEYISTLYYDLLRDSVQESLGYNLSDWIEKQYTERNITINLK